MAAASFDTIVAPATPFGRSALAIVRIDGPEAPRIGEDLAGCSLEERRATFARLRDGDDPIDDAVVVRFVAPRSFTGNDLVEMTLHGSPAVIERLLRAATARGARAAEPGEFTERAVLNGKLDLVQAEAIGDLIESRTAVQAKLALSNVEGALSRAGEALREGVVDILARVEAALDFAEEGYEFIERGDAIARIDDAAARVAGLEATFERGRATARGISAVILGRPNAGKSTLLNFLCGSDRAIVTPIAGTTRDLLRETIELGGLPVTFVDTAGLRASEDPVEQIGVARALDAAATAELVLYLIDAQQGRTAEDARALAQHPDALVLFTKTDLTPAPPGALGVSISGGSGVEELRRRLDARVRDAFTIPDGSAAVV
ncbi:MAG TPA: tRNA uridine-5-carboxymethylaminomethyl(34) synthesis GTPase MnmE, partial [Thermoanaerobaculia bacterium]